MRSIFHSTDNKHSHLIISSAISSLVLTYLFKFGCFCIRQIVKPALGFSGIVLAKPATGSGRSDPFITFSEERQANGMGQFGQGFIVVGFAFQNAKNRIWSSVRTGQGHLDFADRHTLSQNSFFLEEFIKQMELV